MGAWVCVCVCACIPAYEQAKECSYEFGKYLKYQKCGHGLCVSRYRLGALLPNPEWHSRPGYNSYWRETILEKDISKPRWSWTVEEWTRENSTCPNLGQSCLWMDFHLYIGFRYWEYHGNLSQLIMSTPQFVITLMSLNRLFIQPFIHKKHLSNMHITYSALLSWDPFKFNLFLNNWIRSKRWPSKRP